MGSRCAMWSCAPATGSISARSNWSLSPSRWARAYDCGTPMNLPFDWFILLLRVLFVFLLYFFLFQIVRTIARELRAVSIATAGGPAPRAAMAAQPTVQLVLLEATEAGQPAGQRFPIRSGAVVGRREGSA